MQGFNLVDSLLENINPIEADDNETLKTEHETQYAIKNEIVEYQVEKVFKNPEQRFLSIDGELKLLLVPL